MIKWFARGFVLAAVALYLFILFSAGSALFSLSGGCSAAQIERGARDVQYVAGGSAGSGGASTQPALQAAREAVRVVKEFVPVGNDVIALVAGGAALIGAIAGHFKGKRDERLKIEPVIAELAEDFQAHREPNVPFSEPTTRKLEELGYHDVAHVEAPAAVVDVDEFMKS